MKIRELIREMVDIPIGRGKGRATAKVMSVLYHSMRGRPFAADGSIPGNPLSPKEKELEQLWLDPSPEGYVWLSQHPLDATSLQINTRALDPNNLRYTGQSEGYLLHKGPIPKTAIIQR